MVTQILIEKDEAKGIEFLSGTTATRAYAKKEVILAAGAFASPQLLMLSGVGPAEQLKSAGVLLRKELPGVGQNLQDHLMYPVSSLCTRPISNNHYLPWHMQAVALARYFLFKSGPLTIGPLEANAFVKSEPLLTRPDIQFQFTPTHGGNDYTASMYDLHSLPLTDGYTILPTQVRPFSRGEMRLNPAEPAGTPLIDPRYLTAEEDRKLMVKAGKMAFDILEGDAFRDLRIRTHCPKRHDSDEAWLDHIRRSAECVYHPVGTCKMGTDSMAVVDPSLKVHGIDRLRVVDASIMPVISSGNTNAPVVMIAEKGCDLILNSGGRESSH
jgi:choline dehydrogenase